MTDPEIPLYKDARFVFATIAFALVCGLLWGEYISETNWLAIAGHIISSYLGGPP